MNMDDKDDTLCQPCAPEPEDEVDLRHAVVDDPIVGHGPILSDANGLGAIQPHALSSPPSMTPAQRALHNITHLPFHPGCPICVATRRPNAHHRRSHENERVIPLLVADYCFLKTTGDVVLQTVLVLRLYPYRLFYAVAVPSKGENMDVTSCVAKFINTTGSSSSSTDVTGHRP